MLPALKVPVDVKSTCNVITVPSHHDVGVIFVPVVIEFAPLGTVIVMSSTAKEGSVPALSSSLAHENPILTFGLLFALAGIAILNAVHVP